MCGTLASAFCFASFRIKLLQDLMKIVCGEFRVAVARCHFHISSPHGAAT